MRSREIANRYAGALYEAAVEGQTVETVSEELRILVEEIREVDGFERFLTHPLIARRKKLELVKVSFPDLSPFMSNLMALLIRNRREGYLELIYDEFLETRSAAENLARVRVVTAKPLSEEDKRGLTERLEKSLGRTVRLEDRVDEGLLAGARIELEGRTIDASLRAKLSELRGTLER